MPTENQERASIISQCQELAKEIPSSERQNCLNSQAIIRTKQLRVDLDGVLQNLKNAELSRRSRERSLAVTKIQEAIMWLGMDLKDLNAPNPYPNSYKPENAIVDPTADGLKL